jgi:hypothetical protein
MAGGNNYWPPAYSARTRTLYIPSWSVCSEVTLDQESIKKGVFFSQQFRSTERNETEIVAADPMTGEIKKKAHVIYPNVSGVLATAGGLVFTGLTDGSIIAVVLVLLHDAEDAGWCLASRSPARYWRAQDPALGVVDGHVLALDRDDRP